MGGYDDLVSFVDCSGHIVNCSLTLGDRTLLLTDVAQLFGGLFMGGLDRKGMIATGSAVVVGMVVLVVLVVLADGLLYLAGHSLYTVIDETFAKCPTSENVTL